MHPVLRIFLAIAGVAIGATLMRDSTPLLAGVMGAVTGLAIGEVLSVRAALTRLQAELRDMRRALPVPQAAPPRPAPKPVPPAVAVPAATFDPLPWTPVRQPTAVSAPNPIIRLLREYFTGGNALVRSGVVVLFFGVAFLLRYLAEHSHLPIQLRLSCVACSAVVLLAFAWRLRSKRPGYALALQGGAIGILYLTVFSALRLYSLLSYTDAFALLAALSTLAVVVAVIQGSLAVVLLGVTGGFLAPFLAATGQGNHVVLFSYFLVLNLAIFGIAWFRSWRLLNLAGFTFTFVLSTAWGVLQYLPQDFASTEPFLVVFFLIYVAIAVLYSTREAPTLEGVIDGTIIFGTPIAAFGLQAALLHEHRLELTCSALVVSGLYLLIAWLLHRRRGSSQRLLVEAFAALAVAFLTLAVPLAFNGRWSASSWALEGAALIWVGCRQGRRLPRALGTLLQLAAGGALALTFHSRADLSSGTYVAGLMVGIASICAARELHAHSAELAEYETSFPSGLFLWGLLWWCAGGFSELQLHVDKSLILATALVFATVTSVLSSELARRFRMPIARLPAFALLPVMLLCAFSSAASLPDPLAQGGWIAWPLAFLGFYFIAWRHDSLASSAADLLHATSLWLLAALLSWELAWNVARAVGDDGAWAPIAWALVPLAFLTALPYLVSRIRWPLQAHREAYLAVASLGLAGYLAAWSVVTNATISSPSTPLPYFPLANPLDLIQGLTLLVLVKFWLQCRAEKSAALSNLDQQWVIASLAMLGFIWLNAALLRTLHQWVGIPYELEAMLHSTLVQSALSIFWAVLALATMLVATRIRARFVWLTGAGLLITVVIKLFVVDLSSVGTIERIVSFVGVGLLMLILGYFSPLPPVAESKARETKAALI